MDLLLVSLAGFLLAAVAPALTRLSGRYAGWLASLVPFALFGYLASFVPAIAAGETIVRQITWVPAFGINLTFYLDGLALLMALLVTGIGGLIYIYAQGYLDDDETFGRFLLYLSLFMAAMVGLVLSGNLITLFIFWEITSISSYLLIGYKDKYADSRNAAQQALLITASGGLVLLAGLIVLGSMGGSFDLPTLLGGPALADHPLYAIAFWCVLAGALTKSAQVPFHTWLPGAMAAPTPVSAYLHSATMVKAGVYLLARLSPLLAGSDLWLYAVSGFGAATMVVGALLSWQNNDLKRILAYSTVSVLGTLVMLLGIGAGNHYAVEAMVILLLAHALYKGALFMIAGALDHATGTRDIDKLGGLGRKMPWLFGAAIVAGLSKGGIPLLLGFIGKELAYEATLHAPANLIIALTALAVVSNAMVGTSAALVVIKPFLGAMRAPDPAHIHAPSLALQFGPLALGVLSLLFGLAPALLDGFGSAAANAIAVTAEPIAMHLAIWHGITTPLLLSIVTVALAAALYFARDRLLRPLQPLRGDNWGAQKWYEGALDGIVTLADLSTRTLQNGNLRVYVATILTAGVLLVGGTLLNFGLTIPIQVQFDETPLYDVLICVLIIVSAAFATRFESRLAAIAALGSVGFGVALLFMLLGAPDLAMTQFSIEVLAVVLIALIMGRLPVYVSRVSMADSTLTTFVAAGVGVLMTFLVLAATANPAESVLAPYFGEQSYLAAQGRNVVNVILVDFRGFDTLGEITVLSIAGIGVYALSKLTIGEDADGQPVDSTDGGRDG